MALPAQILLPPPSDVAQRGRPAPAQVPPGTIIIGRVLSTPGAAASTTPDGAAAVRVQFPVGLVLVPTDDTLAAATQLYAQVREQEGQTLLALLAGVGRGTVLRGTAGTSAQAAQQTTIDVAGAPSPVETAEPVQAGQPIQVQVQPRGSRAVLQQLPAVLAGPEAAPAVVQSVDGPLLTVRVQGVDLFARPEATFKPGQEVLVRLPPGRDIPQALPLVTTATGADPFAPPVRADRGSPQSLPAQLATLLAPGQEASPASAAPALAATGAAPPVIPDSASPASAPSPVSTQPAGPAGVNPAVQPAPPPAVLQSLGLPVTTEHTAAVVALQAAVVPPTGERIVVAAVALLAVHLPVDDAHVAAAQAVLRAEATVSEPNVATARVLVAAGAPVSPQTLVAAQSLTAAAVVVTVETVVAAETLIQLGVQVTPQTVAAVQALQEAGIPTTAAAVQAALTFIESGATINAPAIAATVALTELVAAPRTEAVQALANVLSAPSTLGRDVVSVREGIAQILPQVPAALRPPLQAVIQGLTAVLVDLDGPDVPAQVEYAARFGGLHTERLMGAVVQQAAAGGEALPQAAAEAAQDARVLLGRLQMLLREAGPDTPIQAEARAAIADGAERIVDRLQGLQLQNLRAPVMLEHLTIELPVPGEAGFESVQLRVYFRPDEDGKRRVIDPRNTTVALLLDTTRLGRVHTTLTIADGHINTDFRVDTEDVARRLLGGAEELRGGLREAGYEAGRVRATARAPVATPGQPVARDEHLGPDGIDVRV